MLYTVCSTGNNAQTAHKQCELVPNNILSCRLLFGLFAKESSNRFSNDSIHNSFRIWLPNKFTPVTCCTYKLMVFWAQHALFIDVFEQLCHEVSHCIASSARYQLILVKRHSNSEKIFINWLQIRFVWSNTRFCKLSIKARKWRCCTCSAF